VSNVVLGLDIGGANLKAATAAGQAATVPFALWRDPHGLPDALRQLLARLPAADTLAVTMTGELCDCFETKRDGVRHILKCVTEVAAGRPVQVWSTAGEFVTPDAAETMAVASANWHALATFVGRLVPSGPALLIDIGSTTTDLIPLLDGVPVSRGKTDTERLEFAELVYTGVRRTPVMALLPPGRYAAELFATTLDVYLLTGDIPEVADDCDTADGRPATKTCAHARISRMLGGDQDVIDLEGTNRVAQEVRLVQRRILRLADPLVAAFANSQVTFVTSGSGEFLTLWILANGMDIRHVISLTERFGPDLATCAPAYAVAVLAAERGA
jgi:probable H4MPT-linked C1 transfer pathway protein